MWRVFSLSKRKNDSGLYRVTHENWEIVELKADKSYQLEDKSPK